MTCHSLVVLNYLKRPKGCQKIKVQLLRPKKDSFSTFFHLKTCKKRFIYLNKLISNLKDPLKTKNSS